MRILSKILVEDGGRSINEFQSRNRPTTPMIFIDRERVPEPSRLSALRSAGYEHAKKFFEKVSLKRRRQIGYFNPYWEKAYPVPIPALAELFHRKCAFCESRIPNLEQRGIVDHFRPKWGTRGLGSDYANDHYWWLAYTWPNLYLSCVECNKQRGPRFPVEGARLSGPNVESETEKALVVDPCHDDPSKHFRFSSSGEMTATSRRGEISCELWGLNRPVLRQRRQALARDLKASLLTAKAYQRLVASGHVSSHVDRLNAAMVPEAEFSGFATQLIRAHLERTKASLPGLMLGDGGTASQHKAVTRKAVTPRYLHEVHIKNFRGIGRLKLTLPSAEHRAMDWLMLIGENSTGKSSVLQAVALALLSEAERQQLGLKPQSFLKRGSQSALIELRFRDGGEPRRLELRRSSGKFKASHTDSAAPTMAYGATRLAPRKGSTPTRSAAGNLFNPFQPLADAEEWLRKLEKPDFDYAVRALKSLMALDQSRVRFLRHRGGVRVHVFGSEVSLAELSDGYQSVIALAADLMTTIYKKFRGGMEAAEGIVLLDEIGAHLHPRWKMRIVACLRVAFPRLQFIASTHDPLCLRGVRNGEIVVLERVRGRVRSRTQLPPIEAMRVDQILESEIFGLRSSMDPEVERQFDRLYALKAKPALTSKNKTELDRLEKRLTDMGYLGHSRSEHLMLSEMHRFIAKERETPTDGRRQVLWAESQSRLSERLRNELGVRV